MSTRVVGGLVVLALGVLFTLDSLNVLRAREYLRFWPIVLVAIGVSQIMQARTPARVFAGVIWIMVGGTMLSNNLRVLRIAWPLFLVFIGGYIVWRAVFTRSVLQATTDADRAPSADGDAGATLSAIGVLSGVDRRISSQAFRGGEVTAFMGGGKVDLREAAPAGGKAVIDVFAVMGGFEILVPETWAVVIEVVPFMGGVDDKTRPPKPPLEGTSPTLVVRGFVMMGGVEIKN
jgi:predicted membrane protein